RRRRAPLPRSPGGASVYRPRTPHPRRCRSGRSAAPGRAPRGRGRAGSRAQTSGPCRVEPARGRCCRAGLMKPPRRSRRMPTARSEGGCASWPPTEKECRAPTALRRSRLLNQSLRSRVLSGSLKTIPIQAHSHSSCIYRKAMTDPSRGGGILHDDERPLEDDEIVRRICAGERELFDQLLRRYNQRLYRLARAVLGSDSDAEDVVQEPWLRAFLHLSQLSEPARFAAWVSRIALYEAWARARRRNGSPGEWSDSAENAA